MSDTHSKGPAADVDYGLASRPLKQSTLLRAGGGLSIAGTCIGFLIFFAACAGFNAAFSLSGVPISLGVVGLVLTLFGATLQRKRIDQDTHVLAAVFASMLAIIGGLFEMAVQMNWTIFAK